jgi:photosystem II stability/assembly factor-like uncharacterized protein
LLSVWLRSGRLGFHSRQRPSRVFFLANVSWSTGEPAQLHV